jgi:hypothetical protein
MTTNTPPNANLHGTSDRLVAAGILPAGAVAAGRMPAATGNVAAHEHRAHAT